MDKSRERNNIFFIFQISISHNYLQHLDQTAADNETKKPTKNNVNPAFQRRKKRYENLLTFSITQIRFVCWNIAIWFQSIQIFFWIITIERYFITMIIAMTMMMVMVMIWILAIFTWYCYKKRKKAKLEKKNSITLMI